MVHDKGVTKTLYRTHVHYIELPIKRLINDNRKLKEWSQDETDDSL